jgi:hypothetical protein
MCLKLQEITGLWRFSGHYDSNLGTMVLQHCQSEGGMNNFATEAASVIKGRVTQENQVLPTSAGWIIGLQFLYKLQFVLV